ncbi:MAG: RluA family pseudouridine synthase [Verrucomicrobiaceae bacterium]|nr:RluA family pseudouridine synthase [Verrucomicrobiaceae bacterium]
MSQQLNVPAAARLQDFLFASFPAMKKIKVKQWLKFGSVLVNGEGGLRHDHALAAGDVVTILSPDEARVATVMPKKLRIVYEDESIIVIDKPVNLLSIASVAEQEKTAYAHLTDYVRKGDPRSHERVWIVHRLDRETSGLMVFARTEEAKNELQDAWDNVDKHYFAVVEGRPKSPKGELRSHLDERNPFIVFSVPEAEYTREAVTFYEVVDTTPRYSLIKLELETGRRHQIRVQLTEIGCPIIGDEKYGSGANPANRLGLHSTYLRIPHPVTGKLMEFESPLPEPLARLFKS